MKSARDDSHAIAHPLTVSPQRTVPLVEPWLDSNCAEAVNRQVLSSYIGPGQGCRDFCAALCELVGSSNCVLTTSGTIALSVAAKALGLKPGDEILVPAYGVISTINAFASIGLVPRLVDIDARTGCLDPKALLHRLTPATRAVCFVNFAGTTGSSLEEVAALCDARGIPLIEDAACAIGQRYRGRSAGSFGTVGVFSFSVPKVVTTGQGGALFTEPLAVAEEAQRYIDQGDLSWRQTNINHAIGTNLRFNDILAALGLAQLQTLSQRLNRKQAAHSALREILEDRLYSPLGGGPPLYNIVFSNEPDRLVETLRACGVLAQRHCRALYEHPPYSHLGDTVFPNASRWSRGAVYLPFGLSLSEEDARYMGAVVREAGADLLQPVP